ncbi:MAG: hypothetical protein WDZ41_04750 [Candidatus Babeliales bacterium]
MKNLKYLILIGLGVLSCGISAQIAQYNFKITNETKDNLKIWVEIGTDRPGIKAKCKGASFDLQSKQSQVIPREAPCQLTQIKVQKINEQAQPLEKEATKLMGEGEYYSARAPQRMISIKKGFRVLGLGSQYKLSPSPVTYGD